MIELFILISSTIILYSFILLPKFGFVKISNNYNINFYTIDNLTIFLFIMTLFSILRLNLYIPLYILCFLIFLSLLTKLSYYFLLFKKPFF